MMRLLVVEPGYCPYQAGFDSAADAMQQVIEGPSQILTPFGTPRIGVSGAVSVSVFRLPSRV